MGSNLNNLDQTENPERREATNCFIQARSALKNGEINTAEKLLRRALKLWPDNYNYTLQLAKLAIQVNKNEREIEELLQKSSILNLSATEPRLLLATQYEKTGQSYRAVSIYKGVLNIDPSNIIVRRKLGQLNVDLGQAMSINTLETRALEEVEPEEEQAVESTEPAPTAPIAPPAQVFIPNPIEFPELQTRPTANSFPTNPLVNKRGDWKTPSPEALYQEVAPAEVAPPPAQPSAEVAP